MGQEEKPERRVQELWSIRELIWHPARLTVKELWLPILQKYLKVFSFPSEITGLMKPLLLFGMRISSEAHGMMAGRRPLAVLESQSDVMCSLHKISTISETCFEH